MPKPNIESVDVAIIGAGPSGTVVASLLHQRGINCQIFERSHFPRFSIGESLLPQCMVHLEEAGLLDAVNRAGFQFKNGAAFGRGDEYTYFDFTDKFSEGPGSTFQVQRGAFDKLLADEVEALGVPIHYGHCLEDIEMTASCARLSFSTDQDEHYTLDAQFVLDASGFGRVLPRLLDLELPSYLPSRTALFTHIEDNISDPEHDRDKILITNHPELKDVWFWLIPFANGRCSMGVAAEDHYFKDPSIEPLETQLKYWIQQAPNLKHLLTHSVYDTPVRKLVGYSRDVKSLHGERFALLGNAGEFLDPIFSSGITIAMKSASLVAPVLAKHLAGETVDWQKDYAEPLKKGVETFKTYVDAWYDGRFQDVVYSQNQRPNIRAMISSILAGYAWDDSNPFVAVPERRLNALVDTCREQEIRDRQNPEQENHAH